MSWEAIVVFIFFALISSLFNKGKQQTNPKKTTNPSRQQNLEPPKPRVQERRTTSGLEDMLRDLQRNMGEAFDQYSPKEQQTAYKSKTTKVAQKAEAPTPTPEKKPSVSSQEQVETLITRGGIGRKPTGPKLNLNRQALLQGIIMSEVLDKPRSLRGRQLK